ncbi:quinol:cytochrome C oxidoreductase [Hymenobacter sp. CRA2]|uniref:quinol:cytochrome C oxidoreductase n=1 Tax=Hymenobacter sp. CRA2 TaxID=1955620 RepID=UPI0009CD7659|nr:quinol:cytochrome C oxidoreductase [Hymenobacter sp. CRA2]OON69174.1 quinol:cytochrome C oxidoreductase [Hymenobacter sp. CRA2]
MASTHHHHEPVTAEFLELSAAARRRFILFIVAGVVLMAIGLIMSAMNIGGHHEVAGAAHGAGQGASAHGSEHAPIWLRRLFASLWQSNVFFLGISAVGTVFVAIHTVAYAGWSIMVRRIAEAFSAWILPGGVILLLVFFASGHNLFHWRTEGIMEPGSANYDAIIAGKAGFLNIGFYVGRMVAFIAIWWFFSKRLRDLSLQEDQLGGTGFWDKSINVSAMFLVLYAVTSSISAWDWVMSIDTHWFSTMFGWYVFASWWVSGIAGILLTAIYLKQAGYLRFLNANHLHDLGKLMFGFSIFWTYVWFSQFMLIWYANLPEEAVYFNQRLGGFDGKYTWLFFFNLIINFAFPFLVLMTRDAKRQIIMLKIVATAVLIGHWLDFYMMIMPGTLQGDSGFIIEIGTGLVFLGGFLLLMTKRLSQASLVPVNHPFVEESVHHTT